MKSIKQLRALYQALVKIIGILHPSSAISRVWVNLEHNCPILHRL